MGYSVPYCASVLTKLNEGQTHFCSSKFLFCSSRAKALAIASKKTFDWKKRYKCQPNSPKALMLAKEREKKRTERVHRQREWNPIPIASTRSRNRHSPFAPPYPNQPHQQPSLKQEEGRPTQLYERFLCRIIEERERTKYVSRDNERISLPLSFSLWHHIAGRSRRARVANMRKNWSERERERKAI